MLTGPIAALEIRRITERLALSARPGAPVVPNPRTTRKR
jgi:hypothetical protein